MPMYANIGGASREISHWYNNIGGVQRHTAQMYTNITGTSKEIFTVVPTLNGLAPGSSLIIWENSVAVSFLVLAHDHHAAGYTTLIRNELMAQKMRWRQIGVNDYRNSDIDTWLTNTYYSYFTSDIKAQIVDAQIKVGAGNQSDTIVNINRRIFLLSHMEVFGLQNAQIAFSDGTSIPYFNSDTRRVALRLGVADYWWTRSPRLDYNNMAEVVYTNGKQSYVATSGSYGVRPAFALLSSLAVSSEPDSNGHYTLTEIT